MSPETEHRIGRTIQMIADVADDLAAVSQWVIEHGEALPDDDFRIYWNHTGLGEHARIALNVQCRDRDEFVRVTRALAAGAAIGDVEKAGSNGASTEVRRSFGSVDVRVWTPSSQVCEKVVVGTREVPAHIEEIVRWECPDSLLNTNGEQR